MNSPLGYSHSKINGHSYFISKVTFWGGLVCEEEEGVGSVFSQDIDGVALAAVGPVLQLMM
jgi:hypothetical protein